MLKKNNGTVPNPVWTDDRTLFSEQLARVFDHAVLAYLKHPSRIEGGKNTLL
jgi:hypothetical protein